ncbi:MAG: Xaa-Pro peptidase family protein [Nitrososphaerota archaeon]
MLTDRRLRICDFLSRMNMSGAIFCSLGSIRYLSGYVAPIETGPNPFEAGPPILVLNRDGESELIVSEFEEQAARSRGKVDHISVYSCYNIYDTSMRAVSNLISLLLDSMKRLRIDSGSLGVEAEYFPAALLWGIQEKLREVNWRDISRSLESMRAVKDEDEVELLRRVSEIASWGQIVSRQLIHEGVSEIEVYSLVKAKIEEKVGARTPLLADMISGERTWEVSGHPSTRRLRRGELVICDLVPCVDGYWGDSCTTISVGEPSEEQKRLHEIVISALKKGIENVRPGISAMKLDEVVRSEIKRHGYDYPHHTGHGLGVTYHEEPKIYPSSNTQLKPGMVLALEPGIYIKNVGGIRLEEVLLVTEDGAEVLTKYSKEL